MHIPVSISCLCWLPPASNVYCASDARPNVRHCLVSLTSLHIITHNVIFQWFQWERCLDISVRPPMPQNPQLSSILEKPRQSELWRSLNLPYAIPKSRCVLLRFKRSKCCALSEAWWRLNKIKLFGRDQSICENRNVRSWRDPLWLRWKAEDSGNEALSDWEMEDWGVAVRTNQLHTVNVIARKCITTCINTFVCSISTSLQ